MSFASDIGRFNKKFEKKSTLVFRGTFLALAGKVILRTPVDTGRARGNWQAQVNRPAKSVLDISDKSGSKANSEARTESVKAKLGDKLYLTNNLPYIEGLENGTSSQAPNGMVKVAVAEFDQVVRGQK